MTRRESASVEESVHAWLSARSLTTKNATRLPESKQDARVECKDGNESALLEQVSTVVSCNRQQWRNPTRHPCNPSEESMFPVGTLINGDSFAPTFARKELVHITRRQKPRKNWLFWFEESMQRKGIAPSCMLSSNPFFHCCHTKEGRNTHSTPSLYPRLTPKIKIRVISLEIRILICYTCRKESFVTWTRRKSAIRA